MTDIYEGRKAIALGDFDGMHLAHQKVVTGANASTIFCVNNRFTLLQKSIFEERYPNSVFADFAKLKDMQPDEFVEDVLINEYHAGVILCGFNFRLGKGANWSAHDLRKYLEDKDVWVRILDSENYKGETISSTRIRNALIEGNITDANAMLGYNFTFENEVVKGDQRGRTIGFPTANLNLPEGLIVPKYGVYESVAIIDGKRYKSFANIGIRPTWKLNEPMCEVNIFDFDEDLYSKTIRVELVRYLREEKSFSSLEELKKQLEYDKSCII